MDQTDLTATPSGDEHQQSSGDPDGDASQPSQEPQSGLNPSSSSAGCVRRGKSAEFGFERQFSRKRQLLNTISEASLRWVLSVSFATAFLGSVYIYQNKGTLRKGEYHAYNTVSVAMQLLLSINMQSSFREVAMLLRWPALALRPHQLIEVDSILSAASLMSSFKLACRYLRSIMAYVFRKKPSRYLVQPRSGKAPAITVDSWKSARSKSLRILLLLLWILLNIAGQVAIALLNFGSSPQPADPILPPPVGDTFVPDVSDVYNAQGSCVVYRWTNITESDKQLAVHDNGISGMNFFRRRVSSMEDPITSQNGKARTLWWLQESNETVPYAVAYRYQNFDSGCSYDYTNSVPTKRTITAHWSNCFVYNVTQRIFSTSKYGQQMINDTVELLWTNDTGALHSSAFNDPGPRATTYQWIGPHAPCDDGAPRCARMQAYQAPGIDVTSIGPNGLVFGCDITVDEVQGIDNKWNSTQQVSNELAKLAASSIALSGYGTDRIIFNHTNTTTLSQFQRYTQNSIYSLMHEHASKDMAGSLMADFAIAALAVQSLNSTNLPQTGERVQLGNSLDVEWPRLWILMGLIIGVHAIVVAVAIVISYPYIHADDSNLGVARLLRTLIEGHQGTLGQNGAGVLMRKEEIAEDMAARVPQQQKVRYGAVRSAEAAGHGAWNLQLRPEGDAVEHGGRHTHESGRYE